MLKIIPALLSNILLIASFAFCQPSCYPWLKGVHASETIETRFKEPEGFQRLKVDRDSFAFWLRNLPLMPQGTPVKDYAGKIRVTSADSTLAAIVMYDIRGKKLEQCMDILIRWYAEYLWSHHRRDDMAFYLPGGYSLKWTDWKNGYRPKYKGIRMTLQKAASEDTSRSSFERYLKEIFYNSYTQTAFHAYPRIMAEEAQIGDFIVKKGSRGHAVMILDIAENARGERVALVGHGDTPARQFYILNYKKRNPWFPLDPSRNPLPLPLRKKLYWEGLRRFETPH